MRFRQKAYGDACEVLLQQTAEHPDGELAGPARYLAAEGLLRQERYEQARNLFERVVEDRDEAYHAESLFGAGKCAAALNDWKASERHFSALVDQFPEFSRINEASYGRAVALHKQKKLDEALRLYEQVTRHTETEVAAKARFMMGEIAFGRKEYREAFAHYLEVAVGYPYREWQALAQYETARCFEAMGEKNRAVACLKQFLDRFPEHRLAKEADKLMQEIKADSSP
jgi:TolA-binding protein